MEVPEPLVKKHFKGGLYAAYTIPFGAFEEWGLISNWVEQSPKYDPVYDWTKSSEGTEFMFGCLEEHLNYINLKIPNPKVHSSICLFQSK